MAVKPDKQVRLDPVPDKFRTDLEVWRFLNQLRDRVGGNSGALIYDTVQDANTAAALEPLVFAVNAAAQDTLEGQVRSIIEQIQEQTIDISGLLTETAPFVPEPLQPEDYIPIGGIIQQAIASAPVQSVFGRSGAVVALEGDYTLNLLGDVTISSPTTNQVVSYNGTTWVNSAVPAGGLSGIVPVANGGTGLGTLTLNAVILGNGTSTPTFVSPGATGNILTSNGTTWISAAPASGAGTVTSVTLTQPAAGLTLTSSGVSQTTAVTSTFALANDLAALEGLSGTGLARRTGADTWTLDTNTYLTTNQTITLSGDVTGSGTTAITVAIATNAVVNSDLAQVSTATIKGRVTAGTGNVEDLTGTQTTTLLDVFTSALKGLAPASGGGTTNFLRADGTWAAPAGGGGVTVTRETITVPADTSQEYSTTVVAASATAASKVQARLVLNTASDQNGYDELADMSVFAIPDTGTITFTLTKGIGFFVGPFYIDYFLA